jgi:AbrB family looped-hinge helix DNA binding protein
MKSRLEEIAEGDEVMRMKRRRNSSVVKVDNSYRVTIPKQVRDALGIYVGQMLTVIPREHSLTLIPVVGAADTRGAFPEIPLEGFREEEDRL